MADLSLAAQAVLCAYRDLSWTPDEEDNGKYLRFSHKAGMAAALRAAAAQAHPKAHIEDIDYVHQSYVHGWKDALDVILAIAAELEAQ